MDHSPLSYNLNILKPPDMKETVSFRKTKDIDIDARTKDVMSSDLVNLSVINYTKL